MRSNSGLNNLNLKSKIDVTQNVNSVENLKHKNRDTSLDIADTE